MSPFIVGLLLLAIGLAGVFWGYRIFRILLPILGGMAGYLIGLAIFPNNLILALALGFGLAILFMILAYATWSVWVTISGVILGVSLGASIAHGLNLWTWLGWIVILLLAVVGGFLVWKIRDEVVIILTAITGAGFVAAGLRTWFGAGANWPFLWFVIIVVLAIVGIVWQWRRYRHLELLGFGGPAEVPGATRAAPAVPVGEPVAAAPPAAAPAAAVVTAGAVAATMAEPEPVVVEPEAPAVEAAAPAFAAAAVVAAVEEAPAEEPEAVAFGVAAAASEVAEEVVSKVIMSDLDFSDLDENAKFGYELEYIEGIGPAFAQKLHEVGVTTILSFFERGVTAKGREELAELTGISGKLILEWINHVDLYRIKGVGSEYADLLEAAGVDTVVELANRNATNLFNKLLAVNEEKKLVRRTPVESQVQEWVEQAKKLPRVITY